MTDGTVHLVGAGPGDPELLTVKARRLLREADLILYDALVGDAIVDAMPTDGRAVDVGKRPDGRRTPQEAINRRMVEAARDGRQVVRLKGGDPNVFGRGGEELAALADHGVPVEVVPGVTSAVAAPGVAGIPLTHRELASSVTVVTGHEDPAKPESALDWGALARSVDAGGTLVVLMGVGRLPEYVATLREHGLTADTPVAMVERATLPGSVAVTGTLDDVVERVREAGVDPPATTVVGDVVGVHERAAEHLATGVVAAGDPADDRGGDEIDARPAERGPNEPGASEVGDGGPPGTGVHQP